MKLKQLILSFFLWAIELILKIKVPQDFNQIDVTGEWTVKLDSNNVGLSSKWFLHSFHNKINLSASLKEQAHGTPLPLLI